MYRIGLEVTVSRSADVVCGRLAHPARPLPVEISTTTIALPPGLFEDKGRSKQSNTPPVSRIIKLITEESEQLAILTDGHSLFVVKAVPARSPCFSLLLLSSVISPAHSPAPPLTTDR